jgi:hypothetical protein
MERRNAQAAGGKRLAVGEIPEMAGGTKNQVRPPPYPTLTANRLPLTAINTSCFLDHPTPSPYP